MCLIVLAHDCDPRYRLVVGANRDEFFDRPTERAAFWEDHPELLGGRDLRSGGTWLGITLSGRFSAVTNFRDGESSSGDAPSRGALVRDYLTGTDTPRAYVERLAGAAGRYRGFSLLVGQDGELWFFSNRADGPRRVEPGIHGLSNHLLDEPWPKIQRARRGLSDSFARDADGMVEDLFALLADRTPAAETELPDTGVGSERERLLSPIFIGMPGYGTRSSTALLVGRDGEVRFCERTWSSQGKVEGTAEYQFSLDRT